MALYVRLQHPDGQATTARWTDILSIVPAGPQVADGYLVTLKTDSAGITTTRARTVRPLLFDLAPETTPPPKTGR